MDNKLEQIVEQVTKDFIGTDVLPLFRDLVNQCKMEITRKLKSFGNKSALGDLDAKMADSAVDLQKSKENNNQSVAVVEPESNSSVNEQSSEKSFAVKQGESSRRGNKQNFNESELENAPPMQVVFSQRWIFISGLVKRTTVKQVRQHLANVWPGKTFNIINMKFKGNQSAFKVGCKELCYDELLYKSQWPKEATVEIFKNSRNFSFRRRNSTTEVER